MSSPQTPTKDPRRVEEPAPPARGQTDASRKEKPVTHLVDPYDMRADPQQDEPGYGHGV